MRRGKIWTITAGRQKLRPGFLDFSLRRQFQAEQIAGLPTSGCELKDHSINFNRPSLQAQSAGVNRMAKIIRQALWLKARGVLIIDGSLLQISPVLLQESQVEVGFRVGWIRPERAFKICGRLLDFLLVCPDLSQPVQRVCKIALNRQRARKGFRRLVNSPLNNQQIADVVILRGSLRQQFADVLSFYGGLRQDSFCSQKLCEVLMQKVVRGRHFQTVVKRSFAALARTLPHLTPGELALRLQFMTGAMAHILMGKALDARAMTGASPPSGSQAVLRELVAFLSGGLRAPAARKGRRRIDK